MVFVRVIVNSFGSHIKTTVLLMMPVFRFGVELGDVVKQSAEDARM